MKTLGGETYVKSCHVFVRAPSQECQSLGIIEVNTRAMELCFQCPAFRASVASWPGRSHELSSDH